MNRKLEFLMEIIFIFFIFIDCFLLLITVFLPIRPSSFPNVIIFDFITSMLLLLGYLLKVRNQSKVKFIKTNWYLLIAIFPFYFIGVNILGLSETAFVIKIFNLLKIFGLIMSARFVARAVDEFVEKSRLVYGFAFFTVMLLFSSIAFFLLENGVNPEVANYEDSLWYVIQTITTVGYGDVVPVTQWGRLIGIIAMISAIGISSLLTAATTSSLMDKLREDREKMAKKSADYFEELDVKLKEFELKMAKEDKVKEIKTELNDIKSEINEIKDFLTENNKK